MKKIALSLIMFTACVDDLEPTEFEGAGIEFTSPDRVTMNPTSPGLPHNAMCVPVLEQCAPLLTCRVRGAHDGRCLPFGPFPAGTICIDENECGENMICMQTGWARAPSTKPWQRTARGVWRKGGPDAARCAVVCDPFNPLDRCRSDQRCIVFLGDDLGICQ